MPGYLVVAECVVQGPEGRLLFPEMNVMENLEMGAFLVRDKSTNNANLQMVFEMFPRLKEREK